MDINQCTILGATVLKNNPGATSATALTTVSGDTADAGAQLVTNLAAKDIVLKFGPSTTTVAVATGCPLKAGTARIFAIGAGVTHAAIACATSGVTSTGNVYFTPVRGY